MTLLQILGLTAALVFGPIILLVIACWLDDLLQDLLGKDDEGVRW